MDIMGIIVLIILFGIIVVLFLHNAWGCITGTKWFLRYMIKKITKRCFRQGNDFERRMFLKVITESIENEYTEDNWYSRLYWLVEEILMADDNFGSYLFTKDYNGDCIKRGLVGSVDAAMKNKKK